MKDRHSISLASVVLLGGFLVGFVPCLLAAEGEERVSALALWCMIGVVPIAVVAFVFGRDFKLWLEAYLRGAKSCRVVHDPRRRQASSYRAMGLRP